MVCCNGNAVILVQLARQRIPEGGHSDAAPISHTWTEKDGTRQQILPTNTLPTNILPKIWHALWYSPKILHNTLENILTRVFTREIIRRKQHFTKYYQSYAILLLYIVAFWGNFLPIFKVYFLCFYFPLSPSKFNCCHVSVFLRF